MIYMSCNLSHHSFKSFEVCWEALCGKFFEGVFSLFRAFEKKCIFHLRKGLHFGFKGRRGPSWFLLSISESNWFLCTRFCKIVSSST